MQVAFPRHHDIGLVGRAQSRQALAVHLIEPVHHHLAGRQVFDLEAIERGALEAQGDDALFARGIRHAGSDIEGHQPVAPGHPRDQAVTILATLALLGDIAIVGVPGDGERGSRRREDPPKQGEADRPQQGHQDGQLHAIGPVLESGEE